MHRLLLVSVLFAASACISSADKCATGVNDVLTAGGCALGGGFEAALDRQRSELARLQQERQISDLERLSLERSAESLAGEIFEYQEELDRMELDLLGLQNEIERRSTKLDADRARQSVLREEVAKLRQRLADEKRSQTAEKEQILSLKSEVARRQSVVELMLRDIPVE
jgi:chromosome segregation ATPase